MSQWTPELKQEVIARYQEIMGNDFETDEDRANHSVDVVKQLATEYDKTVNGVRMILIKNDVYIKKPVAAKSTSTGSTGGKRVNKAEAQKELRNAIETIDADLVDNDIIEKLTGKAAQYFTTVMLRLISSEE